MNCGKEISGELVIARGDPAKVLEPAKAAFDDVAPSISSFVEAMHPDAIGFVGDDGYGAALGNLRPEVIAVIAFVGNHSAHVWRQCQNVRSGGDVGVLAWRQMKRYRPATRIARRVDFGRASAARTTDCLIAFPPFPPEAQR